MSDKPEKFQAETFTLFTDTKARVREMDRLTVFIGDLPVEKVFRVKVLQGEEGRRDVANRLYQVSIGQAAKQGFEDGDTTVIAGKSKFHLLLPQKKVWAAEFDDDALLAEYQLEHDLCDMIAASPVIGGDDLFRAYDRAIRSSTLKIKPFARYLERFLDVWSRKGVVFNLRPSDRVRAMVEPS